MERFELNILGCGSATSSLLHNPSCQVLNVRDNLLMIDCGEGAQLEMRRMRLKFARLNHIFLSHLHGDHCFGLPGLVSTMALLGRTANLHVYTFKEGIEQFKPMIEFFNRNSPFEVCWHEIAMGKEVVYEDDGITVTTFPLQHRIPAVGFIVAEKPKLRHVNAEAVRQAGVPVHFMHSLRQGLDWTTPQGLTVPNSDLTTPAYPSLSYAYASDTRYSHKVAQAVQGVDWLYHEATYGDEMEVKARERFHSTARQAALVAREAGVKQLILGHYSKRYSNDDLQVLLHQAQEVFPHTRLAREGLTIDLTQDS